MASHPDEIANKRKHADYDQRCEGRRSGGGSNEVYGRGYPREDTPPAQCSVLCGPRSCSTLPSSMGNQSDGGTSPPEPKRRRLWGLRGLVKMFRRRVRRKGGTDSSESPQAPPPALRARSASELTVDPANRSSGGPYNQGLSVSHDSVFSPESPTEQTHTAPPGLSLATRGVNMSELKAALRRRRGVDSGSVEDDFDDPGLPRSPPTSPTTLDVLNHGLKSSSRGAQSSCSDGSLLSMGSSENDEDSFGVLSRHSSKHSLIESRHQVIDNEPAVGAAPLSHKAARHKISVRPKRTHAVPRARKQAQALPSSLPTTPEVNEDYSIRCETSPLNASLSPVYKPQDGQRPSSTSFSSVEMQFTKSRSQRKEDRRAERKSLPNPPPPQVDERREEPLYNRIFGSVRSGQSQDGAINTEENTFSEDTRMSREKRKDPFKTPIGSKSSRQKSDPSRLTYMEDTLNERNSSLRSSSVEGRLEGNPVHSQRHSLLDEPIPAPPQFTMEDETTVTYETHTTTNVSRNVTANRLSSSFDSLNEDEILPSSLSSQTQIGQSLESCEGRSSTDSLTTTPLPGIYIRSNQSLNRTRISDELIQARESISRFKEEQRRYQMEVETTGPLSLDSSLNLVQQEVEEFRKSVSVDEVPFGKEIMGKGVSEHVPIIISRPTSIIRSVSVHSPTSSSRGSSVRSRKSSIGDELESDSSLSKVSLRKIKREPSLKQPVEEVKKEKVPEFLRIQLNRVQNKGSSVVIFDTEQNVSVSAKKSSIVNVREWSEAPQRVDRSIEVNEEVEKPRDQSEIIVGGKRLIEVNYTNKVHEMGPITSTPLASSSHALPKRIEKKKSNDELPLRKDDKEEIVLRRPSVVDRAIVIDQSMGALPSSPTAKKDGDEPELFKVFARRSFKLKDPEMDCSFQDESSDVDKENLLPTSSMDINEISGNQLRNTERFSMNSNVISNAAPNTMSPVFKNISSKRLSLGNAIMSIPHSPELKPTVLSVNNSSSSEDSESKLTLSKGTDLTFSKGSLKTKETLVNSLIFAKSQIHSTLQSKNCNVIESDGSVYSSLDDSKESCNVTESSTNITKISSFSKSDMQNKSQSNQLRKTADKESKTKEPSNISSNFNSSIIRKSIVSSSNVTVNETLESTFESSQSHTSKIPSKGQAIMWPPRGQSTNLSASPESTSSEANISPSGRVSILNSKIISSFKEMHSTPRNDGSESHSSGNEDDLHERRNSVSIDNRRKSLKEGIISSSPILAEARNTTFAHTFDSHSSPLTLSYLGRGDSSLKLDRKGSMDETRNSVGGTEDWRVLVRQRREDRMKQTKTPDAEEIIIETRPTVSRNSKVLEMANNFQKLQVA